MRILFFCVALLGWIGDTVAQQSINNEAPDDLYRHGLDLLAHQEYGAAREVFTRFVAASPTDPRKLEAEYNAAFCAVNLYHADGERQMERFIEAHPEHPRATTAYYDLAALFYQQKNYNKAIAYYSKAEFKALTPEQQNIGRFRWGYSLFNQKKLAEALDQFTFIKAQGGTYGPASSYYAGFIEYTNRDYVNAFIDLKRAEQNASYATVVPNLIVQTLYRQAKYEEILSYYGSVKGREGVAQLDEMALTVSEVYFKKADYANALQGYQLYLSEKKNNDRSIFYRAGYAAMKVNQTEAALGYFKEAALKNDSLGYYSSYFLGTLYLRNNQKPQALTAFEVARTFKDDKALAEESSFQYAKIAYDLGRSDEAIEELETFVNAFTSSDRLTEVKEILSHAYINANNYNKAIEYMESLPRRGASLDRAYQKATYLKGTELFNMERYGEATVVFEKSIQVPGDPVILAEAHFWCGESYSIGKRYDQAIDHYAALVSPASPAEASLVHRARYGLGYCYYNMQQYDRAQFNFKDYVNKAGRDDSNLPDALLRLADCYYVSKSYADALTSYRKVLQGSSPDKDYAHLQAGVILGIQRKYREAMSELDQVVRNYPQSNHKEEALFQLAQLDFEQGNYAQAATGFSRVVEHNAASRFVPYAYARRAAANYNLKDYNKTANDYVSLVTQYPTHPLVKDALVPLQEALNLAGRSSEFDQYLAKFKTANPDAKGIESIEFETASNLFFNQQYARAIQNFTGYLTAYPESPRLPEANYYRAESYYRLKDFDRALELFSPLSNSNSFSMITKVMARVAELEFKKGNYDRAIIQFNRLKVTAGNKKEQYTAWSGLMEAHYLLAQYDSADAYAHIVLEKGNINAGAVNKASLFLGKTAMARGDYETAKDEFLNTINTAQDEYGAEAKFLLGELFFLQKDYKTSNETLFSLTSDFAAYTEWVGRAFLQLADNYLAMGERFQARATLKSMVDNDFPLPQIKSLAAEKLRKLDEEEGKKADVRSDSTDND